LQALQGFGVSGLNPRPAAVKAVSLFSGAAMVDIDALLLVGQVAHWTWAPAGAPTP
jgi:hypothetical protein